MKPGILFLDDDHALLSSIKRYLHKYKNLWDMYFVENFEEAVEIVNKSSVDVALLDIYLPIKGGFDLLKHVKKDEKLKNIEIVMLTGMKDQKLKREALDAGAADLLQKPIQPEDLIARIKSTLKVKQYRDQLTQKNKNLEKELVKSQKMELTAVLAAGITHDMRNILTVINNYPYIIKKKLEEKESIEKELKKIEIASRRAESILRQILSFAKDGEIEICEIDINTVIIEITGLLEVIMPVKISLELNLANEPLLGYYNKQHLTQIVMNLILNAKDAIEDNVGLIQISTDCVKGMVEKQELGTKYNRIIVTDNGKGLNQETIKKIFDQSFSTKKGGDNFGFGLSVVKILVEQLNGFIDIKSKEKEGTSFFIYLPVGV